VPLPAANVSCYCFAVLAPTTRSPLKTSLKGQNPDRPQSSSLARSVSQSQGRSTKRWMRSRLRDRYEPVSQPDTRTGPTRSISPPKYSLSRGRSISPSPGRGATLGSGLSRSRGESSFNRSSRPFREQSMNAVRLRKDRSLSKKERAAAAAAATATRSGSGSGSASQESAGGWPFTDALGSGGSSAGSSSLAMNRQFPAYTSMPGPSQPMVFSQVPPSPPYLNTPSSFMSSSGGTDAGPGRKQSIDMSHAQTVGNTG